MRDVQALAGNVSQTFTTFVANLSAGDMAAIKNAAFGLSGFIALIGLWLLIRPAPAAESDEAWTPEVEQPAPDADEGQEASVGRPMRLLEAIAAAKAQVSISAAEEKHAR